MVVESVVEKVVDLAGSKVDYSADSLADCLVVLWVVPMAAYWADSLVGSSGVHLVAWWAVEWVVEKVVDLAVPMVDDSAECSADLSVYSLAVDWVVSWVG
jgi:hypothetical protein